MSGRLKNVLFEYYRDDINALEKLIGKDLSDWKKTAN